MGKRRISSEFKFLILWYKSSAGMAGARETACAPAAHECAPDGARQPRQPAWAPSGTDCPAARGPPRRIRSTGAAEIEMTAPKRSRAAALQAPAALTRPQRASGAGVRSEDGSQILAFQYEQHVHSSLRSVLNHPGPVSESHHRLWVLSSQCCVGLAG